jgi:hypothetical protein
LLTVRFPQRYRSSDSTIRIWTVPAEFDKPAEAEVKVLRHGTGDHKDVTTLEWSVRCILPGGCSDHNELNLDMLLAS